MDKNTCASSKIEDPACNVEYGWADAAPTHMHCYYTDKVLALAGDIGKGARVLDVGCGNGYLVGKFLERGCAAGGTDVSEQGIAIARKTYPNGRFELLSADAGLVSMFQNEKFDVVISTEVVEHLYEPRAWARSCFDVLRPGGRFICSTPYHGYLKNLAIALCNGWDKHANPLWDGGHIKLWSRATLTTLLSEAGFVDLQFQGLGRMPYLWMTMIMSGVKPSH